MDAVGVAQLAEHRTVAPDVVGSIPISHPSLSARMYQEARNLSQDTPLDPDRSLEWVARVGS